MTASRCGTIEGLRYRNTWCPTPHAEGPFAELVYRIPWSVKTLRDGNGMIRRVCPMDPLRILDHHRDLRLYDEEPKQPKGAHRM